MRDDGKGIGREALHNPRSLGLLGIRERARRLGGSASIAALPTGGTIASMAIPLPDVVGSPT